MRQLAADDNLAKEVENLRRLLDLSHLDHSLEEEDEVG